MLPACCRRLRRRAPRPGREDRRRRYAIEVRERPSVRIVPAGASSARRQSPLHSLHRAYTRLPQARRIDLHPVREVRSKPSCRCRRMWPTRPDGDMRLRRDGAGNRSRRRAHPAPAGTPAARLVPMFRSRRGVPCRTSSQGGDPCRLVRPSVPRRLVARPSVPRPSATRPSVPQPHEPRRSVSRLDAGRVLALHTLSVLSAPTAPPAAAAIRGATASRAARTIDEQPRIIHQRSAPSIEVAPSDFMPLRRAAAGFLTPPPRKIFPAGTSRDRQDEPADRRIEDLRERRCGNVVTSAPRLTLVCARRPIAIWPPKPSRSCAAALASESTELDS